MTTNITTAIAALEANGVFAENITSASALIMRSLQLQRLQHSRRIEHLSNPPPSPRRSQTATLPGPPRHRFPHHQILTIVTALAPSSVAAFATLVVNLLGVTSAVEKNYSRQLHKPIISEGSTGGMRKLSASYGREKWRELVPLLEGEAVWEAVRRVREVSLYSHSNKGLTLGQRTKRLGYTFTHEIKRPSAWDAWNYE